MDSATEDIYLQKIEEFVYDEDKIVTFRWLSITLGISISDSKKLLEKYVVDHRSQKPQELAVMYILSGIDENNTLVIALVKENELEDKSDELSKVLNKQIYSVQKCKEIDLNAVGLIDYFDMHSPRESPIIGSIKSRNCIKRIFKQKKALPPPPPPTNKGKTSFFTKIPPKSSEKTEMKSKGEVASSIVNSAVGKEKSNGNIKQNNSRDSGNAKAKKNGIASFFTKGATKTEIKTKLEENIKTEITEKTENEKPILETNGVGKSRIQNLIDSDSGSEDIISPTPNPVKQKPKKSTKRQKKQSKTNAPSPKRRKRIIENNSDSDDIFGNDDDEMNVEENLHEKSDDDSEPIFKPELPLPPKNKKRKLVDRTFTDEEGFIITRKEWVEESGSESESETKKIKTEPEMQVDKSEDKAEVKSTEKKPIKSENEISNDKAVNGKAKGGTKGKKPIASNQQTLMSFFKKK